MTKRFEVIRKSTPAEDRRRRIAGMKFLAKTSPNKYKVGFDKDGDFALYESLSMCHEFWCPVEYVKLSYEPAAVQDPRVPKEA